MALNTPKLDKAVEDFKKVCDRHWQLYRYGQFYVTNLTIDDLQAQIEANLKAHIRFQMFRTNYRRSWLSSKPSWGPSTT